MLSMWEKRGSIGYNQLTHVVCSRLHSVIMLCVHSDGLLVLTLTGALHDTRNSSVEEQAFVSLVFH